MARRLTLLAMLACAATALRPHPPPNSDLSDSGSMDPFDLWAEYDDSFETTPRPPPTRTHNPSAKVIIRGKRPRLNSTVKTTRKEDKKKIIKTTNINIESYTNIIITKKPLVKSSPKPKVVTKVAQRPGELRPWIASGPIGILPSSSTTIRSPKIRPTSSTRRPPDTRHPKTTRRPVTTTLRQPSSTARRKQTTKSMLRPKNKSTKVPSAQKISCPPKSNSWISSFFNVNKLNKAPKKPVKTGIFSTLYSWISKLWFGNGGWFQETKPKKPPRTTTTATTTKPISTTTSNDWFQMLLDSEEEDVTFVVNNDKRKPSKRAVKKNYKGYQLLRAYPEINWKVHELLDLQEEGQGSGIMWWTMPSINGSTDILVPPDLLADVKDYLKSNNIEFDVVIWDLQKAIAYENPRLSKKQRLELEHLRGHPMTWRRYHRYADILRYLEYLQHSHADMIELVPLGRSSEGLPLVAVKISLQSNETDIKSTGYKKKWKLRSRLKPSVWLEGGAHSREWIGPAVATWMLHALVEGEKGLGPDYEILKQADFYIMPVLNPDGYEHSHTHDRLWRKTRSRLSDRSDDYYVGWFPWNWGQTECIGVDTDRNWDYQWGEKDSSLDPCSDNYAGPHPFSEPETRAVSEFLAEHRGQMKVYISLHAYSQAWLLPSSHAHMSYDDDGVLMEMGKLATAALADLYGTKYQIGTAAEIRQPASGMSHDWAKANAGIKFAYHVDLRDSFGPYGFLLPGSQIVSTARETWQAVKTIVDNLDTG